ncbi:MAG: F0F1 ATP synthase subunit B [Geminicoccaceae bacterium]|nr:F0F1 ATP synthase subunit B [Geminicoccaceae bacterium]
MLEFMLLVALLILVVLVWKPVKAGLVGGLDNRAERIRTELDEAQRLHAEARELLATHKQKLADGEKSAAEITAHADAETRRLQERLQTEFEALVARREQQALDSIAQEEARAQREVRARATELTVRTTRRLLTEKVAGDVANRVLQDSIGEVQRKLA